MTAPAEVVDRDRLTSRRALDRGQYRPPTPLESTPQEPPTSCLSDKHPAISAGVLAGVFDGESTACGNPRQPACFEHRGYSVVVDAEDFERFGYLKWTATVQQRSDGTFRVYAYRNVWGEDGKCRTTFLHRAIVDAKPGEKWDHEDRDSLNCRRSNLRLATASQNSANRTVTKITKHGFFGIDSQTPGRFRGRVMVGERSYYTKTFKSPLDAAIARDALAVEMHGAFAVTNASLGLINFPAQAGEQCA